MGKGRKKLPTVLKAMQGTTQKSREVENEMQVDLCESLPEVPELLSKIGKGEWHKVTKQLFNLNMLHSVDLRLVEAYCNEISLYIECEMELRKNDSLNNALKLATQFGLTPVARASISAPTVNNNTQINNYFE